MNTKWKKHLLKSSIPLEFIVSKELGKLGFGILGEYTYYRVDRDGKINEFSVDINAHHLVENSDDFWATINLLVECKYSDPNTHWVFTPLQRTEIGISQPIRILDDLTTRKFPDHKISDNYYSPLEASFHELPTCFKGVKLFENGCDIETINRGFSQLVFAIPDYYKDELEGQIRTWNDEDLTISIVCPILVTTSPLLILKENVDLKSIHDASNISDIAEEVSSLILHKPAGVNLREHSSIIYKNLIGNEEILKRISGLNKLRPEPIEDFLGKDFFLRINYFESLSSIIVVNLNDFGNIITKILSEVKASYTKLHRLGYLIKNIKNREKSLSKEKHSNGGQVFA